MKQLRVVGLALAPSACAPRPEPPPTDRATKDSTAIATSIFREIDLRPFGKVALGAPFTRHSAKAVPVAPGLFALESGAGSFANTDSILVRVDAENRVRALYFVYQPGVDFAAALGEYQVSLGPPTTRAVSDFAGGQVERAVWEDSLTRFEMTRDAAPSKPARVTSTMFDRATLR